MEQTDFGFRVGTGGFLISRSPRLRGISRGSRYFAFKILGRATTTGVVSSFEFRASGWNGRISDFAFRVPLAPRHDGGVVRGDSRHSRKFAFKIPGRATTTRVVSSSRFRVTRRLFYVLHRLPPTAYRPPPTENPFTAPNPTPTCPAGRSSRFCRPVLPGTSPRLRK